MHVAVGSLNPVKKAAVEQAFSSEYDELGSELIVEPVDVDSGVSEQPIGHTVTKTGAITRAKQAHVETTAGLGVGLEGGVARYGDDEQLYLIMWAAVTDGEQVGTATGPSMGLPKSIAQQVTQGQELGPVMDATLGTTDIATAQGAAGVFTNGRVDRTDALATAVAGALGPFVCSLYE